MIGERKPGRAQIKISGVAEELKRLDGQLGHPGVSSNEQLRLAEKALVEKTPSRRGKKSAWLKELRCTEKFSLRRRQSSSSRSWRAETDQDLLQGAEHAAGARRRVTRGYALGVRRVTAGCANVRFGAGYCGRCDQCAGRFGTTHPLSTLK